MTQVEAAKTLGITQARVSDIKRGKIGQFSLDLRVRIAARAGLRPKLKLVGSSAHGASPRIKPSADLLGNSGIDPAERRKQLRYMPGERV